MRRVIEWNPKAVDDALTIINTGSLECVEYYFDDAIATVSACLRGLIISAPGHDLICSDYSAIEAVVLAALAGEEWRLEVFKTHGQIYEMSAAKVTGLDFQEFGLYKSQEGKHHPYRKIGKVAELASGYQGWLGAWKQFGADEFFSDDEIKQAILAWRDASPNIVEFWGGQQKKWQSHYYGLEGAAILATLSPGIWFNHNSISYIVKNDILYCQLPSGRNLCYHKPRLAPSTRRENTYALSFESWNANPTQGKPGWIRLDTYGGKLTENVVQAVARDILAYAIINLENAGYPVVIHVHDEIVVEVSENFGSVAEVEFIMSTMPEWAKDWPLKAKGGWRDKRYQK
jgi:DNA polymerase